jgi:hypothetical protein
VPDSTGPTSRRTGSPARSWSTLPKLDEVPGFLGTRRPRLGGSPWPSISPQAVVQLHDQYGPPVASRPVRTGGDVTGADGLQIVPTSSASWSKVSGPSPGARAADDVALWAGVPLAYVAGHEVLEGDKLAGSARLLRFGQVGATQLEHGLAARLGRRHVGRGDAEQVGGSTDRQPPPGPPLGQRVL